MPLVEIPITPGLVTEQTARGAKASWRDGNRVRFRQGLPEKLGGWQERVLAGGQIVGIPRGAIDWRAVDGAGITGVGTNRRLYQIYGSEATNITPYRLATDEFGGSDTELTDPFDTTDTEQIVEVTRVGHGLLEGATVYFANATPVGGLTIDGEYEVIEVLDADSYTIDAGSAATSTANGGGTVDYAYEINVGASSGTSGFGWGSGAWGASTWGTPRGISAVVLSARIWSLDTWGEDLIANPRNGAIYLWDKSAGYSSDNRAALIDASAPDQAAFVIVSPVDRHLIALGCTPSAGGNRDPLVIRWCSQNDYTDWTASRTNTSGERRLDGASEILSGLLAREEILIFTDVSLFSMRFIGPPTTFNIRRIGGGCGLLGPLARAEYGGIVAWMGYEDFFYYDGGLSPLPCPIRNHIFDDMNLAQQSKFFAGVNSLFQEIMFFYCSAGSSEIDRYALYQVVERHWSFGELERTAWLDQSSARASPAAFDSMAMFYDHEAGNSANGAAMGEYVSTWDMEVPEAGNQVMLVRQLVPDFLEMTGPMKLTMQARKYPHGEQIERGPFDIATSDSYVRPRIRGRQIALRWESDQMFPSTRWRMGPIRLDARPHGRR